jgi:hypothetical protein
MKSKQEVKLDGGNLSLQIMPFKPKSNKPLNGRLILEIPHPK